MKIEDYPQLFRLSNEVFDSLEMSEVIATIKDMNKLGIDIAPTKNFAIEVDTKFFNKMLTQLASMPEHKENLKTQKELPIGLYVEYKMDDDKCIRDFQYRVFQIRDGKKINWYDQLLELRKSEEYLDESENTFSAYATLLVQILVVLLATKNSVRSIKANKDLVKGKFNKANKYRKDYPITTTISIGHITETMRSNGDQARAIRPHLRRGHIRNQHYGPNNELIKAIFIQPCFVNADEGWIAERRAYNVH